VLLPLPCAAFNLPPPATQNPVIIELWLEASSSASAGAAGAAAKPRGRLRAALRRLLQAEKVTFRTDAAGRVLRAGGAPGAADVLLRARRWAEFAGGPGAAFPSLYYDILLEESLFGVPRSGLPLVGAAALGALAAAAAAPWWARAAVPAMQRWLAAGEPASAPGRRRRAA
jgi:hypothetical protein